MNPDDRVADNARRRFHEQQEKVREFEALMDEHGVEEPTRFALRQWVEEHIVGPVLEVAERQLKGSRKRN